MEVPIDFNALEFCVDMQENVYSYIQESLYGFEGNDAC
jgi:hypothetical protein